MNGIEFVCQGNNARSPMAEVIANDYAHKIGADIPIYSSGVKVKTFLEDGPEAHLINTIRAAGITGKTPQELTLNFMVAEGKLRNQALAERGYSLKENHIPTQTDPRKKVDLFLAVAPKEKDLLLKLDCPERPLKDCKPQIVYTIKEYAHDDASSDMMPSVSLIDWLTDVRPHLVYVDALAKVMPRAIDHYICEFNQ